MSSWTLTIVVDYSVAVEGNHRNDEFGVEEKGGEIHNFLNV